MAGRAEPVVIEADEPRHPLRNFWNATGFTPGRLLLEDPMRQQVIFLGAVPRNGMQYVRPHDLLELVDTSGWETGEPAFDWSRLDAALDVLVENRQRLVFEIMGTPGERFSDIFRPDRRFWEDWRVFVRELALHLMDRYGREEVESWWFETWNEPDLRPWAGDYKGLLRYYTATREGLKEANPALRFGGPGNAYTLSLPFTMIPIHAERDRFSDGPGPGIDFFSVHEKGGQGWDTPVPSSNMILDNTIRGLEWIAREHPDLRRLPFLNTEADPLAGWSMDFDWRTGPYYPAFMARVINMHQVALVEDRGVDYPLHHNDHMFLGGWKERTMFVEYEGESGVSLVKRPSLTVFELMALLGEETLRTTFHRRLDFNLHVLATRHRDGSLAILVVNSVDEVNTTGGTEVELVLRGLPFARSSVTRYRIDEQAANPYAVWLEQGSPARPTDAQLKAQREAAEAVRENLAGIEGPEGRVRFRHPLPGVSLLLVQRETPAQTFDPVNTITLRRYQGLNGAEIVAAWAPNGAVAAGGFLVEGALQPSGPFEPLHPGVLLSSAFVAPATDMPAYLRVVREDAWGRRVEGAPVSTAE